MMGKIDGTSFSTILLASCGVALVLALLSLFPLSAMGPAAVVTGVVGLAWLVYHFLEPVCLLHRHALVREVSTPGSSARRWLWKGRFLRFLLGLGTLWIASVALMTADSMADYEWALLLASLPVFALVLLAVRGAIGQQVLAHYESTVSLTVAYGITLALLVVSVVAWQILGVEVPSTAHMAWHKVLVDAYTAKASAAATPWVGWAVGVNAALTEGAWHVMQVARAGADSGRAAYLAGCALLLGWSAIKLGAVWIVLLGLISLAFRHSMPHTAVVKCGASNGAFATTLVAAVVFFVGLNDVSLSGLSKGLAQQAPGGLHGLGNLTEALADPCEEIRDRERRDVLRLASHELSKQQTELDAQILRLLDRRVDTAFAPAERAVDWFLDWNFSLEGQYAQLAYLAASAAGSRTFESYIASKVDEQVHAVLDPALRQAGYDMRAEMAEAIETVYRRQDAFVTRLVEEARCLEVPGPTVAWEDYMRKSLVGAGAGVSIIGTRIVNRMGARMVSHAAMKRAIAAVATKGATRTATTVKGGLAGLACGPYAPFCVAGFALAAWFGTDVAINTIDEALHRDEMRAEMLAELDAARESFKREMHAAYLEASEQVFHDVSEYHAARFNIYRDGG